MILGSIYKPPSLSNRDFLDKFEDKLHTISLSKSKCPIMSNVWLRSKGFFASRVSHFTNSISTFQTMRIILNLNVSVNPGPAKCPVPQQVNRA